MTSSPTQTLLLAILFLGLLNPTIARRNMVVTATETVTYTLLPATLFITITEPCFMSMTRTPQPKDTSQNANSRDSFAMSIRSSSKASLIFTTITHTERLPTTRNDFGLLNTGSASASVETQSTTPSEPSSPIILEAQSLPTRKPSSRTHTVSRESSLFDAVPTISSILITLPSILENSFLLRTTTTSAFPRSSDLPRVSDSTALLGFIGPATRITSGFQRPESTMRTRTRAWTTTLKTSTTSAFGVSLSPETITDSGLKSFKFATSTVSEAFLISSLSPLTNSTRLSSATGTTAPSLSTLAPGRYSRSSSVSLSSKILTKLFPKTSRTVHRSQSRTSSQSFATIEPTFLVQSQNATTSSTQTKPASTYLISSTTISSSLPPPSCSVEADHQLQNGGFESGLFAPWLEPVSRETSVFVGIVNSETQCRSGKFCLLNGIYDGSNNMFQQSIVACTNRNYIVSGYAKASTGLSQCFLQVCINNPKRCSGPVAIQETYTLATFMFHLIGRSSTVVQVYTECIGKSNDVQSVFIDDIEIRPI